jgi:FMN phosphatase YigB (HAD superfamily)
MPIKKESAFASWCKKEGVKRFLLDMDDTICPTRAVFVDAISRVCDYLAASSKVLSRQEWEDEIEEINNAFFEKYGVNPNRWDRVVDVLAEKYGVNGPVKTTTKQIFGEIYETPLSLLPESEVGLSFIKNSGIPVGIVTHANYNWTLRKYGWLNLERFLPWHDIFIVDENKHKTLESWLDAIRYFGLEAGECAVVGDSPRSDINPVWEAGVRHCFLIEDPNQWSIHDQPVNPDVTKIQNLAQIPEMVLGR